MPGSGVGRLAALAAGTLAGSLAASAAPRRRRRIGFAGRVVLVAGGSRGLGLELARRFGAGGTRETWEGEDLHGGALRRVTFPADRAAPGQNQ